MELRQARARNVFLTASLGSSIWLVGDLKEKLEASQEALKSANQLLARTETKHKIAEEELRQIKLELGM